MTARQIGRLIGDRWVDGGIVGPPPLRAGTTRLYLSGPRAGEAARLFQDSVLEPVILSGSPVAASALKMAYAAWTKGSAALLLAALASARAYGVQDALQTEWQCSVVRASGSRATRRGLGGEQGVALGRRDARDRCNVRRRRAATGLSPGGRRNI
jgi:hypothetical protein